MSPSEYHLAPCRQRAPGLTHIKAGVTFPTTCVYCMASLSEFYTAPLTGGTGSTEIIGTPAPESQELPRRVRVTSLYLCEGRIFGVILEPMDPSELNPPEGEPAPGPCQIGKHPATRTWLIPRDAQLVCATCLREVLRRAAWPWRMAPLE